MIKKEASVLFRHGKHRKKPNNNLITCVKADALDILRETSSKLKTINPKRAKIPNRSSISDVEQLHSNWLCMLSLNKTRFFSAF